MKSTKSNLWPYIIVGSAVGGAVTYLFTTDSCRKVRQSLSHPSELSGNIEQARDFIETKARTVTGKVRGVLDKAKLGMEDGQRAFHEAEQNYRANLHRLEGKNNEIASSVHKTVDNMTRTAHTVEESILDPLYEIGALIKGIERGIRTAFGRNRGAMRAV